MFGLDSIGDKTVHDAQAAVEDIVLKLGPLFRDVENRGGGILHGLLDRLNETKITITVEIPPVPKATAVDQ